MVRSSSRRSGLIDIENPCRLPKPKGKKILKSKKDGYRKCRYCGISRPTHEMTLIPSNLDQLSIWIQLLGPGFAENIKKFKSNYICRKHIENEERSLYRIPKNVHNITLANTGAKVPKTSRWKTSEHRVCRYCGISRPGCETTTVPNNPTQLSIWIELLGPQFATNIQNSKYNFICLSHIGNEERGRNRLPKNVNNIPWVKPETKIGNARKNEICGRVCRYCGIYRRRCDTTMVPRNAGRLIKWIEILGPEFAENIKNFKANAICLEHIKREERSSYRLPKKRDDNSIPITDQKENVAGEKNSKKMKKNKIRKSNQQRQKIVNDSIVENGIDVNYEEVINEQNQEKRNIDQEDVEINSQNPELLDVSTASETGTENVSNSPGSNLKAENTDQELVGIVLKRSERLKSKRMKSFIEKKMKKQDDDCVEMI